MILPFIFLFGGPSFGTGPTFSKVTFSSITFSTQDEGAAVTPIKPPGGDDAPGWVNPTYIKEKKRKRRHEVEEDLEALYDRVMGIKPVTKEAKKAVAAVKRVMAPHREPDQTFDWEAVERDLKVAIALRRAWKAIQDDEDEALTALLLAG